MEEWGDPKRLAGRGKTKKRFWEITRSQKRHVNIIRTTEKFHPSGARERAKVLWGGGGGGGGGGVGGGGLGGGGGGGSEKVGLIHRPT